MKTLLITVAIAASTFVLGGSPASAQPVAAAVSTAGLDLSTEAGLRKLDLRILHAASALCGTPSSADARGRFKAADCRAEARAAATSERDRRLALARRTAPVELAQNR